MTTRHCPICRASDGQRPFEAREMMFGMRHPFVYAECGMCGCLYLPDPPDLSPYYPRHYYSLQPAPPQSGFRAALRSRVAAHLLGQRSLTGALLFALRRPLLDLAAVGRTGVTKSARVLDVGSGSGDLLAILAEQGFTQLLGIDPFLDADRARGTVLLRRARLEEVRGRYDLIIMNQSLEHMPDHRGALEHIRTLLGARGALLIRTPIAGATWREYGADWYELDAPRHLIVHSERSLKLLAADTGFDVVDVTYDSTAVELAASEQYRRDIPLLPDTPRAQPIFTRVELRAFDRRIRRMNRMGTAGRASFVLRPHAQPSTTMEA